MEKNIQTIFIALIMVFISSVAFAASRVDHMNFESETWTQVKDHFSGDSEMDDHVDLVDESEFGSYPSMDCHGGSKCLRYNIKEGILDPITGKYGESNPIWDLRGANAVIANATTEVFIRYWYRYDNVTESGMTGDGKLGYFITTTPDCDPSTSGPYIGGLLLNGTNLTFTYNNGCGNTTWSYDHYGYQNLQSISNGSVASVEGNWVKVEIYVNYTNKYIKIWVDDYEMITTRNHCDGDCTEDGGGCSPGEYCSGWDENIIYYDGQGSTGYLTSWHIAGWQFTYCGSNCNGASNGSEVAVGVMLDDIEIFTDQSGGDSVTGTMAAGDIEASEGGDETAPVITIDQDSPQNITENSLEITMSGTDAAGTIGACKYRIGAEPDADNGTSIPADDGTYNEASEDGTVTITSFSEGENTLYIECDDDSDNWSTGNSITVNFSPVAITGVNINL